jgi:rubrerythrin
MGRLRLGGEEHKKLFCRMFSDSFRTFEVRDIKWPELDEENLKRLRAMPFWDEAVKTERVAGMRVRLMAEVERDPMIREMIAMQAYEETRHSGILESLMQHCGIEVPIDDTDKERDAEWGFIRMGYGEVCDSFFAFGLFRVAGETGLFSPELMKIFDEFMDEEARHIVFFVNWAAYRQKNLRMFKPWFSIRRALGMALQAYGRMETALQMARGDGPGEDFVMQVPESVATDVSVRRLFEACLEENNRRLAKYDERLLRPTLVPKAVKLALRLMPAG